METSSLTSGLRHRINPTKPSMPPSVTLLTISTLRFCRNIPTTFCSSFSFKASGEVLVLVELPNPSSRASSSIAGDNRGLGVLDGDPSAPLSPLGGRNLGAGNPFKKCSSSASDPLSLFVDSRPPSDTIARLSCASLSVLAAERNGRFRGGIAENFSEGLANSDFCLRYGCGDRDNRRTASSRWVLACDEGSGGLSCSAIAGWRQ